MKLIFCAVDIVPVICPYRDTTPKVCCCDCPDKWECHERQKEMVELNHGSDTTQIIMPCVNLGDDEEDPCIDCEYLT
jgi:hypothetical protein